MFNLLFAFTVANVLVFFAALITENRILTGIWFWTYPIAFVWCVWFLIRQRRKSL